MLTIKTKPDCTLGFIRVPKDSFSFEEDGLYLKYIINQGHERHDIGSLMDIGVKFEIIDKLSEITEEQARELVNISAGDVVFQYTSFGKWKDTREVEVESISYINKLKSLALSIGIEEKDFDKYLVVKLLRSLDL